MAMERVMTLLLVLCLAACTDTPPPQASQAAARGKPPRPETPGPPPPSPGTLPKPAKPAAAAQPAVKPGQVTGVGIGQLFSLQQAGKVHLVDVRPPLYFRLGHIGGAVNFPLVKYDARLAEQLPLIEQATASGKTVVLYCQNANCPDAYKTAQKLARLGHSVSIYKGGWEEWKKSGLQ